jgi:hypothetical protein
MESEKLKTYTEAQKRAIYRYKEKNRDKINNQAKKDYQKIKEPDQLSKRNYKMKIKNEEKQF